MPYVIQVNEHTKINLVPTSIAEEVIQNVTTILSTPKFSVPLDRGFGLSAPYLDKPTPAVKQTLIAELFDAIEKYERRARIKSVTFTSDEMAGKVVPVLEVDIVE